MATTGNMGLVAVRGMKVILYGDDGKKYIYKFGDPTGDKELFVQISMEQEYDEYDTLLDSAKIFKSRPAEYTFKVRP